MLRNAFLVLLKPQTFIQSVDGARPKLEMALQPLLVTSGLLLLAMFRVGDRIVHNFEGVDRVVFSITYSLTVFGSALSVLIVWLGITGATHLLSLEFGGARIAFSRFAVITAWATMPIAAYALLVVLFSGLIAPISGTSPETSSLIILRYGRYTADAWSVALVVMATIRLYRQSVWRSILIVGAPVLIQMLSASLLNSHVSQG